MINYICDILLSIVEYLPECVNFVFWLKLAVLFWTYNIKSDNKYDCLQYQKAVLK